MTKRAATKDSSEKFSKLLRSIDHNEKKNDADDDDGIKINFKCSFIIFYLNY